MLIGVIGNGFVGKATNQLKCKDIQIYAYDINPEECNPKGIKLEDMKECEIIFVSVPTPMNNDGSCYLKIVESVVNDLRNINYDDFIVIRSTIPPGTADRLNCYFMPEFLTEKNFLSDFVNNKEWIFGVLDSDRDNEFKNKISNLFDLAFENSRIEHNNLTFLLNKEAEMVKMFRNCFLSTKVSFCNEMYQFCEMKGINYENVRKLATADERILPSHSKVPGHDGKKGFGGTCFPKDSSSLRHEMKSIGMKPYIMDAIITRNEEVDRPSKDWESKKGRSVIE